MACYAAASSFLPTDATAASRLCDARFCALMKPVQQTRDSEYPYGFIVCTHVAAIRDRCLSRHTNGGGIRFDVTVPDSRVAVVGDGDPS